MTNAVRAAVQAEARRWVGTPVVHQHAVLGHGVDCWNHIEQVGKARRLLVITPQAWAPFAAYGRQPSPALLMRALQTFLVPAPRPDVADIACIAWRPGLTMHLAIRGEFEGRPTLIHALESAGRVVEHGLTGEWPALVDSWWRYPGLTRRRGGA